MPTIIAPRGSDPERLISLKVASISNNIIRVTKVQQIVAFHPSLILGDVSKQYIESASRYGSPIAVMLDTGSEFPRPILKAVRDATRETRGRIRHAFVEPEKFSWHGHFSWSDPPAVIIYQAGLPRQTISLQATYSETIETLMRIAQTVDVPPVDPEIEATFYHIDLNYGVGRLNSPNNEKWEWIPLRQVPDLEHGDLTLRAITAAVDYLRRRETNARAER